MTIKFITFGGGKSYIDAANRLIKQAERFRLFDSCTAFTDADLKNNTSFWDAHGEFIEANTRGYGYWIWKPWLIKNEMAKLDTGDILVYLDSGCELIQTQVFEFKKCIRAARTDSIVGDYYLNNIENQWTKMDLLDVMGCTDPQYTNSPQRTATGLIFLITDEVKDLIDQWCALSSNYHLIDDSPSVNRELPMFKEHRHDQSIFSLLSKKLNLFSSVRINNAVHIARNRSGKSVLPFEISF